jgi:hypothetical protein
MKRTLKIGFRVVLSAIIAFTVLEVCVRVDDLYEDGAPFWGNHDIDSIFRADVVGRRGISNARFRKWKLNNAGFRGPDLREGTVRVVCIGASETFGMYESEDKEFPRQLEADLNRSAKQLEFEVINVAYPGQSLRTALRRIPEYVDLLKPKYGLLYINPTAYIEEPTKAGRPTAPKTKLSFRIAERFRELAKRLLPDLIQAQLRARNVENAKDSLQQYRGTVYQTLPEGNVERFRSELTEAIDDLVSHGVFPIVITHATRFGPNFQYEDPEMLLNWRRFNPGLKESGFADMERRTNRVVREIAAEKGVGFVDAAGIVPPGPEYFQDFVHFTDAGAEVLAKQTATVISLREQSLSSTRLSAQGPSAVLTGK